MSLEINRGMSLGMSIQRAEESQTDYNGRDVVLGSKDMNGFLSSFLELEEQASLSLVNRRVKKTHDGLQGDNYKILATYLLANKIIRKTHETLGGSYFLDPEKAVQIVQNFSLDLDDPNFSFEQEADRIFDKNQNKLQALAVCLDRHEELSINEKPSENIGCHPYRRATVGLYLPRRVSLNLDDIFRKVADSASEQEGNSDEIDECDADLALFLKHFDRFSHILESSNLSKSEKVDAIFRHAELKLSTMLAGSLYPNIGVNRMEAFDVAEKIYPHLKAKGDLHFANMFLNCSSEFDSLRFEVERYKSTAEFAALSVIEKAEKVGQMILRYNVKHPQFASCVHVKLVNKGLNTIPDWVKDLELKYVNLSKNLFTDIPDIGESIIRLSLANNRIKCINWLNNARKLQILDISGNDIVEIPNGFLEKATGLLSLNISENNIVKLSDFFNKVKTLVRLDISGNGIVEIPNGFLSAARRLLSLNISGNRIVKIPSDFLSAARRLLNLNISRNRIVEIPSDFLSAARRLKTLNISDNDLKEIPVGFSLSEAKGIRNLKIGGNKLGPFNSNHPLLKAIKILYKNRKQNYSERRRYGFDRRPLLPFSIKLKIALIKAFYWPSGFFRHTRA